MKDMKETGQIIKSRRSELKLSQKQLADLVGVQPSTISRWETGSGYPDQCTISKVATELGITVNDLLGLEAEEVELFKKKRKYTFKDVLYMIVNYGVQAALVIAILAYSFNQFPHFQHHTMYIYYTRVTKIVLIVILGSIDFTFFFIKPAREQICRLFYRAKYKHRFPGGYDFEIRKGYYLFINVILLLVTLFVLFVM